MEKIDWDGEPVWVTCLIKEKWCEAYGAEDYCKLIVKEKRDPGEGVEFPIFDAERAVKQKAGEWIKAKLNWLAGTITGPAEATTNVFPEIRGTLDATAHVRIEGGNAFIDFGTFKVKVVEVDGTQISETKTQKLREYENRIVKMDMLRPRVEQAEPLE